MSVYTLLVGIDRRSNEVSLSLLKVTDESKSLVVLTDEARCYEKRDFYDFGRSFLDKIIDKNIGSFDPSIINGYVLSTRVSYDLRSTKNHIILAEANEEDDFCYFERLLNCKLKVFELASILRGLGGE